MLLLLVACTLAANFPGMCLSACLYNTDNSANRLQTFLLASISGLLSFPKAIGGANGRFLVYVRRTLFEIQCNVPWVSRIM